MASRGPNPEGGQSFWAGDRYNQGWEVNNFLSFGFAGLAHMGHFIIPLLRGVFFLFFENYRGVFLITPFNFKLKFI